MSNFIGTEIEIWADFGRVGNAEKFDGGVMFSWALFFNVENIVARVSYSDCSFGSWIK